MLLSPELDVYLCLRKLELALARPGALENLRDVNGDALGFTMRVSKAIDNYEIAYPDLKKPSPRDNQSI